LITTATFMLTCCLEGSVQISLHLHSDKSKLCVPSAKADPVNFSAVLLDYHGFTDVFSKNKTSLRTIYSFPTTELDSLCTSLMSTLLTPLSILLPLLWSSCLQDKQLTLPLC
ncbi:hypothetical protein PAXRUDRAFT_148842, partial [Paxillus rubicundulus Ve08.2h10]